MEHLFLNQKYKVKGRTEYYNESKHQYTYEISCDLDPDCGNTVMFHVDREVYDKLEMHKKFQLDIKVWT